MFAGVGASGGSGPPAAKPKGVPKPKGPSKADSAALLMTSVEVSLWTGIVVLLLFSLWALQLYMRRHIGLMACAVTVHSIRCV